MRVLTDAAISNLRRWVFHNENTTKRASLLLEGSYSSIMITVCSWADMLFIKEYNLCVANMYM